MMRTRTARFRQFRLLPDHRIDLIHRDHRASQFHWSVPPKCPWAVPLAVLLLQSAALLERIHRSPEAVVLCCTEPAILGGPHAGIQDEILVLIKVVEDIFPEH